MSLGLMIGLFAVVNIRLCALAISVWAVFGAALRGVLAEGRRIAVFNVLMAVVLVAAMVPVLVGG